MTQLRPDTWLYPHASGLYCEPGGFFIDPHLPVERAVITHGHSDHARPGHAAVLATPETIAIMQARMGADCAGTFQSYGGPVSIGDVTVTLVPAGHILGSAQVAIDYRGQRAVISGDYKRDADPTCAGFEPLRCHLFITEATFGLPVFRHGPAAAEARRLADSLAANPERSHLLGVYGLGKCQRMLMLLRQAGYDAPIYLHGALLNVTQVYQRYGMAFGDIRPATGTDPKAFRGALVMSPPSAVNDRWSRRLPDPVACFASGWMRVRGRARQRGVELPLVVSDHADWPQLLATIAETEAEEVWVTHGREAALVHVLTAGGRRARALALVGYEDEDD